MTGTRNMSWLAWNGSGTKWVDLDDIEALADDLTKASPASVLLSALAYSDGIDVEIRKLCAEASSVLSGAGARIRFDVMDGDGK